MIGALDFQSTERNAFKDADMRVFQTMADQLAIAIENASLFERAQQGLRDIEQLNRRLAGEGWREFQRSRPGSVPVGYRTSPDGVTPIQLEDESEQAEPKPGTLSVPLIVRGEPIGVLDVTPRSGHAPGEDVESIIQAVAERVAQALDATRLGEQAIRQAEREQALSRLSAELQATTDLDVILRIAAREAGRALGTPRGFVHLIMEYGESRDATAE
jgi:GAF domain-containing protein